MPETKQILESKIGQAIGEKVILAPFTTFKIGGPADYFFEAETKNKLTAAIKAARESAINFFVLGTGANILVSDKGFRGFVIRNKANQIEFKGADLVRAESGVVFADLIEACALKELSGLEHFAGIPSSVGGALWQNLHFLSPDRTRTIFIEEVLASAEIMTEDNQIKSVSKDYFKFGYDESVLRHKKEIALEATFKLLPAREEEIRKVITSNLAWRNQKHPPLDKLPSAGSVFKNIPGHGAGRLIDACGLKGTKKGNAQIYEKHANMIVNLGDAKAKEVIALMELAKGEVRKKFNLDLEPEISLVGGF